MFACFCGYVLAKGIRMLDTKELAESQTYQSLFLDAVISSEKPTDTMF